MKTLAKLLIMLSAAAFVAFSCEQGPELEPPVVTPEDDEEVDDAPEAKPGLWDASAVTFSISAESPSTWAVGDVVKVFDDDFVRVEFTATDAENPASFTTSKWTGYIPAYAVYSLGTQYCDTDEGIIKYVQLPAEQKLSEGENCVRTAFPAVGKFEEDDEVGYKMSSMKNVSARLAFTFVDDKIKALKIEGLNDEIIAGQGNIKYEDFAWIMKEDASQSVVTLLPAGDAFVAGSTVYASLLPGTFANGLRVTLTNLEDLTVARTFYEDGIVIERNDIVTLPDAIDTPQSQWRSTVVNTMINAEAPSTWMADDVVAVFDQDNASVPFTTTETAASAMFSTTEWTGKTPVYAAFTSGTAAYDVASNNVTLTVPVQQQISAGTDSDHKAMPAVAEIKSTDSDFGVAPMTNVAGRVAMTFMSDTKVKSVKIQGVADEAIAGTFKYNVNDQSITEASETIVTITPSGETFEGGSTVYAAVLPGNYASGLKVTLTLIDNSLMVKTFGENGGIVVERNKDVILPEIVDLPAVAFPEEFVVAVNLQKSWPFKEAYSATVNDYTYVYTEGLDLNFRFDGTYNYASGLDFSSASGKLILPQVEGRYLNSVVVVHEAAGSKKLSVHKVVDDVQIGNTYKTHVWKQPVPVANFSPHSADQCYVSLVDAMKITHIYLLYNSSADGDDAVKLGFESPYKPYNNNGEGDGSVYVNEENDASPFIGISHNKQNNWDEATTPNPYTFTQTVNSVSYTFEGMRPSEWKGQYLYGWTNGMFNCNWGSPNLLKLPRKGKLVWAAATIYNAYNATKTNRTISIESMDQGDADYTNVGSVTHMASVAQGTGDGTTVENSASYKAWCLEDAYSPTKDYYISCVAGNTTITFLVLIYL